MTTISVKLLRRTTCRANHDAVSNAPIDGRVNEQP